MHFISIIGAGSVGTAVGARLSEVGLDVIYGVRNPDRTESLPGPATSIEEAASRAQIVVIAVPAPAALEAGRAAGDLAGKIVVDCTNPLRWIDGPEWDPPREGSVSAQLQNAFPEARVVKAFNHFGVEIQRNPALPAGPADAYVASDDDEARSAVIALAERMGFRAYDAGPLRNAALLESLAVLWIHLATVTGVGRSFAFRVEGRG